MLRENNIRTGFLESKQHDSLAAETGKVGLWLRAMFETGYTYSWRHEELLALRVRQVNLVAGTIRLEPGTTKNSEGREVSMSGRARAKPQKCQSCSFTICGGQRPGIYAEPESPRA
jgi:integrase